MNTLKKSAFTLVELLVVVTILSILAAVGFVSYSEYIVWVRDTNRKAQLEWMSNGLTMYSANRRLPVPDAAIKIMSWSTTLSYQWTIWQDILDTIEYTKEWTDPDTWKYFTYYMTSNKKYFQLFALLEEKASVPVASNLWTQTYADSYVTKFPYPVWKKLWVLTGVGLVDGNKPIQEIIWMANPFDLTTIPSGVQYTAHLSYLDNVTSGDLAPILWELRAAWWKYCKSTWTGSVICQKPNVDWEAN